MTLQQTSPTLGRVEAYPGKLLSKILITDEAKRDMMNDPENWVRENIAIVMAETLEARLLTGNPTKTVDSTTVASGQTKGLLTYATSNVKNDRTRPFGTICYVPTGANGNFIAFDKTTGAGPLDALKTIRASLKKNYRAKASWLFNTETELLLQTLKDDDGNYLWRPSMTEGDPNRLLGYPVKLSDFMPDPAANSLSIVFGDFKRALRIGYSDVMRMERDVVTQFPNIFLMFAKFYDLTLRDSRAIKFLKFSAS